MLLTVAHPQSHAAAASRGFNRRRRGQPRQERRATFHLVPALLPGVHNVHRLEKLDWGFLSMVIVVAHVPGWAIEVLRAVATRSDVLPLRAGPCISDTMSMRAACSLLAPLRAAGAVGQLASSPCFGRAPHGRPA